MSYNTLAFFNRSQFLSLTVLPELTPKICVCTAPDVPVVHKSLLPPLIMLGATAVGGGVICFTVLSFLLMLVTVPEFSLRLTLVFVLVDVLTLLLVLLDVELLLLLKVCSPLFTLLLVLMLVLVDVEVLTLLLLLVLVAVEVLTLLLLKVCSPLLIFRTV